MMICPDCRQPVGRFMSKQDEGTADFATIRCPQSGRKVIPEFSPEIKKRPKQKLNKQSSQTSKKPKKQDELVLVEAFSG